MVLGGCCGRCGEEGAAPGCREGVVTGGCGEGVVTGVRPVSGYFTAPAKSCWRHAS